MNFIADIKIMPQKALLDPQGKAVGAGLNNMGIKTVSDVRVGKHITLQLSADTKEKANEIVTEACKKLLANLIMESFEFSIHEA